MRRNKETGCLHSLRNTSCRLPIMQKHAQLWVGNVISHFRTEVPVFKIWFCLLEYSIGGRFPISTSLGRTEGECRFRSHSYLALTDDRFRGTSSRHRPCPDHNSTGPGQSSPTYCASRFSPNCDASVDCQHKPLIEIISFGYMYVYSHTTLDLNR